MPNALYRLAGDALSRRAVPERSGVGTLVRRKWRNVARPSATGESFLISVSIDFQESMVNRAAEDSVRIWRCAFHAKQCAGDLYLEGIGPLEKA